MANLETLELTISGNAASAKSGIDGLITSLTSLGTVVSTAASNMARLNLQLSRMQTLSKKMPNIGNMTGGKGAAGAAKGPVLNTKQALDYINNSKKSELTLDKVKGANAEFVTKASKGQMTQKQLASEALSIRKTTEQYEKLKAAEEAAENPVKDNVSTFAKLKQSFSNVTKGATDFFGKVKRIATTMLIRSAIRGLIKDIREGVNNLYEWSKLNNGEFAQSLDTLKAKSQQLKNSIGASIAPIISAAIPVINSLANAAINAFNWVNQLLSLLTGKGYWTKATEGANDYAEAAKGAGGATQEWLASFDELNVMNSSGGGGGGGGAASEYADMFENVYEFDSKIRDIADFLKSNFESIKAIVVAIGVAIAAWKLSQAFAETLPLLSKIAGLIGVGAVIAITLQANWMLTNEYLKTGKEGWLIASILTTAVGSVAAGAIAQKVFGGQAAKYTIGFTLILSAFTDIVANIKNTNVDAFSKESLLTTLKGALSAGLGVGVLVSTIPGVGLGLAVGIGAAAALFTFAIGIGIKLITQKDNVKWGNISLTIDQIEDFVGNTMFVGNPKVQIKLIGENVSVGKVERENIEKKLAEIDLTMTSIKLGLNNVESFKKLKEQAEGLIKNLQSYINNAKETGALTLQFTPTLVGATEADRKQWFDSYTTGWDTVSKFYEEKGKEIANLLVENEKGEIIAKNPELLQTLMTSLSEVTSAITESGIVSDAESKMRLGLGDLTKATGDQVLALFTQYKKDLTDSYTELVQEQYKKQGELVAALGKINPNSQEYKEALKEYKRMGQNLTQAVEDGVTANIEPGKNMVMEWLLNRSGNLGVSWDSERLKDSIKDGIEDTIENILLEGGFDVQDLEIMDVVGITGWSLFSNDLKDRFIKATIDAYGSSGISEIKSKVPEVSATDIIKVIEWSRFSTEQKFEFLNAIKGAFGSKEAIAAARKAGIDIGDLVQQGMQSKDSTIRNQAEEWDKIINDELKSAHTISVQMSSSAVSSAAAYVKNTIEALKPSVTATAKYASGYPQNLKTEAEAQKPALTASVKLASGSEGSVKGAVEAINPTITATLKAGDLTGFKNAIKSAFTGAINSVSAYINGAPIKINAKAEGGLVRSGDLFLANENGNSEMIGKFGNHTAVANQEQMVEAMARGVQYANEEQNSLLRRQNELLMGILQKDSSVRLSASSALGRIAKQSIGMYETATGV